jgi:hypothetical protein
MPAAPLGAEGARVLIWDSEHHSAQYQSADAAHCLYDIKARQVRTRTETAHVNSVQIT